MKTLIGLLVLAFAACNTRHRPAEASYPGIYTRHMVDELGSLWDTLYIGYPQGKAGPIILVRRSSRVVNKDDNGAPLPAIRKRVALTAAYNPEKGTIDINQIGEQYILLPGDTTIFNGFVEYNRLK